MRPNQVAQRRMDENKENFATRWMSRAESVVLIYYRETAANHWLRH